MSKSVIGSMLDANTLFRMTASLVVFFFLFTFNLHPALAGVNEAQNKRKTPQRGAQYTTYLQQFKERIGRQKHHMEKIEPSGWFQELFSSDASLMTQEMDQMLSMKRDFIAMHKNTLGEFDQIKTQLQQQHMSDVIMQRHEAAVAKYTTKFNTMMTLMDDMNQAESDSEQRDSIGNMHEFMKKVKFKRSHNKFDPNKLPFKGMRGKTRKPSKNKQALHAFLFPPQPVVLAANEITPGMLQAETSDTDFLQASEAVQITQQMRDLAAYFGKNPVEIFNFVYNNTGFIPSFGSIQGSDMTLQTGKGNAHDTSSLLIALLRAADIPAQFRYGVIRVPIDQAMNWVGGAKTPKAALELLAQGGIPSTGVTVGGKFAYVDMEHVWVEAFVDFEPSRGVVNRKPDTWIPMDASFKQFDYEDAPNYTTEPPFDISMLYGAYQAEVNDQEGWIKGADVETVRTALAQAETSIYDWADRLELEDRWIKRRVYLRETTNRMLSSTLPYKQLRRGDIFTSMPDSQKKQFEFALYASKQAQALDSPVIEFKASLPGLAGKRVTFGFLPVSNEDRDLMSHYLLGDEVTNEPLQLGQVASQLPGYLIRLKAVLWVDDEVVAEGGVFTMGEEVFSRTGISLLAGGMHSVDNVHVAGEFAAIGLDLQGIPFNQMVVHEDEHITGSSLFHYAITSFFVHADEFLNELVESGEVIAYRQPSFGMMGSRFTPTYHFGIPKSVKIDGLGFDIDLSTHSIVAQDNNQAKVRGANLVIGLFSSSLENEVLSFSFSTEEFKPKASSTTNLLAQALREGQRIYTITRDNLSSTQLNLPTQVLEDIQNAVQADQIVQVSEKSLIFNGQEEVGYIIQDPETGNGAYRIYSVYSGANGGELHDEQLSVISAVNSLATTMVDSFFLTVLTRTVSAISNAIALPKVIATGLDILRSVGLVILSLTAVPPSNCTAQSSQNLTWRFHKVAASAPPLCAPPNPKFLALALLAIELTTFFDPKQVTELRTFHQGTRSRSQEKKKKGATGQKEQRDHIVSALGAGKPHHLIRLNRSFITIGRQWYNSKKYGRTECNKDAREILKKKFRNVSFDCDEYPFFSSVEGGAIGDLVNKSNDKSGVSLRLIRSGHNRSAGFSLGWFYWRCGVRNGTAFRVTAHSGITFGSKVGTGADRCYNPK